ncbi:MAG TPA: S8 family serine peptidase [Amaricoccus sp.]|uniref:S8 family serine peptidase n=2 Tax=Amaricoccus sp. TaxID=1872485 RepID=UPI002BE8CA19|nr:S8 family serine peptidase [Amaricoccus sp.]HMR53516.1 S8 family serine peptidase [Amaricoccus sp.]HMU00624.1 S8 family serine peptidase [Amaricoccus sp.]
MRYFIKAYCMHEYEVRILEAEEQAGTVQGDVQAGYTNGLVVATAEDATIERLAGQGIVVQALGVVPEGPSEGGMPEAAPSTEAAAAAGEPGIRGGPAAVDTPSTAPSYWLAQIVDVSDETMHVLAEAGAEIIERDPSGRLVLRAADAEALRRLPFVSVLQPYGVADAMATGAPDLSLEEEAADDAAPGTRRLSVRRAGDAGARLESAAETGPVSAGRFEAICHEQAERDAVADRIADLGGTVVVSAGRVVRFILNAADVAQVAALPGVASVAAARPPRLRCDLARVIVGLERAGAVPAALPYDGAGELVGVADTGLDTSHPDFAGKAVTVIALGRPGDGSDPDGHGTHVAGTIAGSGAASGSGAPLRGVAPAADLYFQSILDANGGLGGLPVALGDLLQPAYDAGVRVHNDSWGAYIQSRYDSMALDIDAFVHAHPDFTAVVAAGNDGSCLPGHAAQAGFVDFPSLGSPATAKNAITVGASRSSRTKGGYAQLTWHDGWPDHFAAPIGDKMVSGDTEGLAAFSARGPCDDFRIKPDVVAPGTDIAATRSKDAPLSKFWGAYPRNRNYAFLGGTSMACPIVAGCATLVRQYFRTARTHPEPSAALIKATIVNGTTVLTGADAVALPEGNPNFHQGFGRIDMARTLPDPAAPAFEVFFVDTWQRDPHLRFLQRKGRRRWEFVVNQPCELRITLAWTDYPGRSLQNQLRIILDTRRGGVPVNWIGNADGVRLLDFPAHDPRLVLAGQTNVLLRDPQNNVHVIRAEVEPGSHTLALFADGLIWVPQDFALVATYPVGGVTVTERP